MNLVATPSLRLYLVQDADKAPSKSNLTTADLQLPIHRDCAMIGENFPRKSCKGQVLIGEIAQGDLLSIFDEYNGSRLPRSLYAHFNIFPLVHNFILKTGLHFSKGCLIHGLRLGMGQ